MTRDELLEQLKKYCEGKSNTEKAEISVLNLNRIIKALEQEPCDDVPEINVGKIGKDTNVTTTDAVDRQAVNELVDELARAISDERCCMSRGRSTATIMQDILHLPSVTPQPKMGSSSENPNKWIACSDRLPDTLKDVIIAFANEPDEYDIAYLRTTDNKTYIANGSKKEWVSSMGETTYAEYEVDAWMPIPPYQPEIPTGQIVANGELYPGEFDDPLAEEGSDKE